MCLSITVYSASVNMKDLDSNSKIQREVELKLATKSTTKKKTTTRKKTTTKKTTAKKTTAKKTTAKKTTAKITTTSNQF